MTLNVFIESLGCAKNLVDSEVMMGLLQKYDYKLTGNEYEADIIIVNTCAFIDDAKQESIDTIIELGRLKKSGNCKVLVVAGCLGERYAKEVLDELDEVDAVVGTSKYTEIIKVIDHALKGKKIIESGDINVAISEDLPRILSTPKHTAYLKISEGCDNYCTYCIIPKLRGAYRSREMEHIIEEAKDMVQKGVKEIVIIAQDTSVYGVDLYGEYKISELLRKLCEIDELKWIRLLYCYPDKITDELIHVIAEEEKICEYLDLPLQHCNNDILKRMNRKLTKEHILEVMNKLRSKVTNMHLRTSLIVGFPGETEEQFEELKEFVTEMKFDRLGVFTYSKEEGTPAANFKDQVPEEIKNQRRDEIMMIQKEISFQKNLEKIGNIYDILVEEKVEGEDVYVGRSRYDASDVDCVVYFDCAKQIELGSFVQVKITDTLEYDLLGEIINESCE